MDMGYPVGRTALYQLFDAATVAESSALVVRADGTVLPPSAISSSRGRERLTWQQALHRYNLDRRVRGRHGHVGHAAAERRRPPSDRHGDEQCRRHGAAAWCASAAAHRVRGCCGVTHVPTRGKG